MLPSQINKKLLFCYFMRAIDAINNVCKPISLEHAVSDNITITNSENNPDDRTTTFYDQNDDTKPDEI